MGEKVVGRTRYCTQPPRAVGKVAKIGGTKKVNVRRVLELEPDLVIAVREENAREDVETLEEAGIPVLLGEQGTVGEAIAFLKEIAGKVEAPLAEAFLGPVERVYGRLAGQRPQRPRRVFVPIWKRPYMSVGSDTYAHDVIRVCGGENVFGGRDRYPTVDLEEIESASPETILLPDEPYPFSAEDLPEFYALDSPAAREDRIHLIDGKLLTWYGPRIAGSLAQLAALLRY